MESNLIPKEEIQKYLFGVEYPASKVDLIVAADDNGAPENIIEILEKLTDTDFKTSGDVALALNHLE